ncbi:hypothetical protein B0H14DRAFT_2636235 [Mycena olivaceomarginata]|nr:hypothetical protein B0H14DRAFT_2636235 [Mycena olivaceomarginata]
MADSKARLVPDNAYNDRPPGDYYAAIPPQIPTSRYYNEGDDGLTLDFRWREHWRPRPVWYNLFTNPPKEPILTAVWSGANGRNGGVPLGGSSSYTDCSSLPPFWRPSLICNHDCPVKVRTTILRKRFIRIMPAGAGRLLAYDYAPSISDTDSAYAWNAPRIWDQTSEKRWTCGHCSKMRLQLSIEVTVWILNEQKMMLRGHDDVCGRGAVILSKVAEDLIGQLLREAGWWDADK